MTIQRITRSLGRRPFIVLLSGVLAAFVAMIAMKLWQTDLNHLFIGTGGDSVLELMGVKNMIETGTRNEAFRLGGETGQRLYDYPVSDFLNYSLMWIISLFTQNASAVMNVFYFLCFPLAAMAATWALLELEISRIVSMAIGLLYPFLPYHFLRNQNHLLLSAYYMVPLGILAALWIAQGRANLSFSRKDTLSAAFHKNRNFLLTILFCLLISSTGLYYAFFACYFLLLALLANLFAERTWKGGFRTGVIAIGTVIFGVVLNYLPTILYHAGGGERAAELSRPGESAEIYGLKIIDLFLPTIGHRIPAIEAFVNELHSTIPITNENITVSLGLVGSIGLLALLITPIIRSRNELSDRGTLMRHTSLLMYGGIFLAMQGGFSALVCRLFLQGIRAYNRIVVFLFFFALIAAAVLLDVLIFGAEKTWLSSNKTAAPKKSKVSGKNLSRWRPLLGVLLVPLTAVFLFDLIPHVSEQDYAASIAADREKTSYFSSAEAAVSPGTLVYNLPFTEFPEPYTSYGSSPYSQLTGYLYTRTLRFSYGAMGGTKESEWAKNTSLLPAADLLAELKAKGYGAILIDLYRYPDDSLAKLAEDLITVSGAEPIYSTDGQLIFLPILANQPSDTAMLSTQSKGGEAS